MDEKTMVSDALVGVNGGKKAITCLLQKQPSRKLIM